MKNTLKNIVRIAFVVGLLAPASHAIGVSTCIAKVKQACMDAKSGSTSGQTITIGSGAQGNVTGVVTATQTCDQVANTTCSATSSPSLSIPALPIP